MGEPEDGEDAVGFYAVDGDAERDVGGDVAHAKFVGDEHHGRVRSVAEMREQAGVAVEVVAGGVEGFLVNRRGDDRAHAAGEGEFRWRA